MASAPSIRKGINAVRRPQFLRALVRHRVAAASEHLGPIRLSAANTLIDVGANKGQFSLAFRSIRRNARIIAFEPLPEAAATYCEVFRNDPKCVLHQVALASTEGTAQFHVADRADSSSLLKPGAGQERAFGVRARDIIEVPVRRLEDCINLRTLEQPILMKVDVQGGELAVFEGFTSLTSVNFIYVELSFVELYENQPLFQEVHDYLNSRGFFITGLYNQVTTPDFGPTQVDVLFKRTSERK